MLQSWGDLTQVQIYGYGTMVGSDGKPLYLDDAAIASIKQIPHVAAATPYAQAYNLEAPSRRAAMTATRWKFTI